MKAKAENVISKNTNSLQKKKSGCVSAGSLVFYGIYLFSAIDGK